MAGPSRRRHARSCKALCSLPWMSGLHEKSYENQGCAVSRASIAKCSNRKMASWCFFTVLDVTLRLSVAPVLIYARICLRLVFAYILFLYSCAWIAGQRGCGCLFVRGTGSFLSAVLCWACMYILSDASMRFYSNARRFTFPLCFSLYIMFRVSLKRLSAFRRRTRKPTAARRGT